ncbi:MAG TPA: MFS transporter [Candidatus Paceibacterota bacterium]|nr:MFS transporter [Candidatus Paceibacterota bacterium]
MRIAYSLVVVLYLSAAILRSKLKETIKTAEKIKPKNLLTSYPQSIKESIAVWKKVPRSVYFLFISNLILTFAISLGQLFFSVYAVEGEKSVLNISQIDWALVSSALFIAMIIAAIPIGKLIDKIGRKAPLLLSHVVFVPAILLFIYGDLATLFIAMPLLGIGQLLFFSSFASLQTDLVPRKNRAKVIGFSPFVSYVLMALGLLAGGIIYSISPQLPFLLMMTALLPSFLVVALLVHEPEKRGAG